MKPSYKIAFLLMTLFTCSISIIAQPRGGRMQEKKENIAAMKIAFITQKLDLTPEEAQKFWPVYNQYSDKIQELRKKRRKDGKEAKQNLDELTDREIEQLIDQDLSNHQKELDLEKEYKVKFKSVLPMKKIAKLYAAEEQFKLVLLEKLKDRKQPPPPAEK